MHQTLFKTRTRHWETSHPPSHEFRFISLFLPFQQDMSLRTVLITPTTPAINMDLFPFFYLSQHPTGDFNVIYSCPPLLKVGWFCCWTSGLLKKIIMFLINCNAKICVHMFYSFCDSMLRMTNINRVLDLSNLGIKPFISKLSIERKRKHSVLFSNMKPFHWQAAPALSVPLLQLPEILTFSLD